MFRSTFIRRPIQVAAVLFPLGMFPLGAASAFASTTDLARRGEWHTTCGVSRGAHVCYVVGNFVRGDQPDVTVVAALYTYDRGKPAIFRMLIPVGYQVQSGARMSFGGENPLRAHFAVCTTKGCYIEGPLSGRQFASLMTDPTVVLSLTDTDKRGVSFRLPMDGLRAAVREP